jgi:hypothetical protein
MIMNTSVETLIKRFDAIKSQRSQWDILWQECSDYCLPQRAIITKTRTPGTKLKTDIYDSTAIQGAQIFAAGLNSYLTNPASRWFALGMKNRQLADNFEVKNWLKECEEGIFDYLNSSNFNQIIHEDYIDFAVFGNSILYEEESPKDIITFAVRPISEIYFLTNAQGKVDTIYRSFTFTARQAYQKWGKNSGQKVLELMASAKVEEPVNFLHIVLPREERDVKKRDARNMPFASLYIEPTTKKILSEGGYEEFPFFIGRAYKVSDSEYAYSPASLALADVKMLNTMSRDILEAAQKTLHPPVILPHDGYLLPFKTSPKAINYKLSSSPDDKVESLQLNREIGLSLEMENQRRTIIQRAFFVDLFLMLANLPDKDRTATEVMERVNERMLILGPILGRLMYEKLDPLINRTFNILLRNGKLPAPPDILSGQEYKIDYISPLAKAQKSSETKSLSDLLLATKTMVELDPSVADNVNIDKMLRKFTEINYLSDVLRSDEEIQQIRQMRTEAQQAQSAMELMQRGGEGAKAVLEAEQLLKGGGAQGGRGSAGKPA